MISGSALRKRTLGLGLGLGLGRMSCTYSSACSSPRIVPDSGDDDYISHRVPPFSTVTALSQNLYNWVSLIGTVVYPFKPITGDSGNFGAHTILLVNHPPFRPPLRILLAVWDLLAERALAHLKPNDNIYVSGRLGSYSKFTTKGTERLYYQVTANEINYVQVPDESYLAESGEEIGGKSKKRLLLLQSFFANPDEWYDDRNTKKSWKRPDFIHKRTNEAIWLNSDDPHWVKKQLKIIDSRLKGTPSDEVPFSSSTSDLSGECLEQKHKRRLPLWQSLFANPDEWYDYRKTKKHWRHPDFRHKKTVEVLWLNRDDPSWVKEHVKLLDSGLSETEGGEMPFGSRSEGISGHQLASSDSMETDLLNDMSNEK